MNVDNGYGLGFERILHDAKGIIICLGRQLKELST